MLKLVDGFEGDVVTGEMKVHVDGRPVFPTWREAFDDEALDVFFEEEFGVAAELEVPRVDGGVGYLEWPVPKRHLSDVEPDVRHLLHVTAEVVGEFAPGTPSPRVGVATSDVEDLGLAPFGKRLMYVWVLTVVFYRHFVRPFSDLVRVADGHAVRSINPTMGGIAGANKFEFQIRPL
jgi:hypothetical protein